MTRLIDFCAARLPVKPAAYLFLFITWGVILWFLSEGNPAPKNGPDIPHLDKVAHFGYFFGGGGLLAAYGGLVWRRLSRRGVILTVTIVCCVIGRLDEYHQSFNPNRSGNDTGDWIADTLGGWLGAWVFLAVMLPKILQFAEKKVNRSRKLANSLDS
ncbi:MAG: VanZ family protein [Akkermansiaceae bacterium]